MERRRFLNLLSMGVVGGAVPSAALAANTPKKSDPKDAPICKETLSLTSGTKPKKQVDKYDNFVISSNDKYDEHKSVHMAVGRDGQLWLKTENGEWKRIVTE